MHPGTSSPTLLAFLLAGAAACTAGAPDPAPRSDEAPGIVRLDRPDLPLARATAEELARFDAGDALFEATLREADGLGPLFIRSACVACHRADGRGPGLVGKMVAVAEDGRTALADQSALRFGATQRPYATAGATTPIGPPGGATRVRLTYRLPPAAFGRGYMEAVADEEIERLARLAAARPGGIRGRIHRVRYDAEPNPGARVHAHGKGAAGLIGRFGLKARIATLDEFTADAFQSDMGITSPLRPAEPRNPDGLTDDRKPGVDVGAEVVNAIADYLRLLEIPRRRAVPGRGRELFAQALCAACHVPSLKTRPDYPIAALAGIEAPVYTDFLLHDMGAALADGVVEGEASGREWRTAPLVGLRFFPAYMHDGRARTIEEAIVAHEGPGSEANESVRRFRALPPAQRAELLAFVGAL